MDYQQKTNELIDMALTQGASDLHLGAGVQPVMRVAGQLTPLLSHPALSNDDRAGILGQMLPSERLNRFKDNQEADFSYTHKNSVRLRGNAFVERGSWAVALRIISTMIRSVSELGLPPSIENFAAREQGFFLVVGPVGQGKTTTLAALIEKINLERAEHIVTIEDPIEYLFQNKRSLIDQREVTIDTQSFEAALHSVFREDIDVLMVGEMRTPESIAAAVTAAETGHLVFSTLHTNNAAQTIDRIIDSFPPGQQDQIRIQLAGSLAGIFSQRLVPRISGGLVPACELLINNNAVANLIREKRSHEVPTVIETGTEEGMIDMNRSLADLVRAGEITVETAYTHSLNPKNLERLL
jgi:twitching motility protein PilT